MTAAATHSGSRLAPGYKLDRYELLCPIAEGGMASVWVARQRGKHGFEKLVAIKTILPAFANDPRFQAMFLDEARIASRIEHANVAQILDLGEEHDVLYLAMEYVDGDSFSKLNHACTRAKMRMPAGILLRVLADACAGLHEAHELLDSEGKPLEIVHRDVSPHNLLVSTKGVAKVIDFGIAKARSRAGGETNSGVLKGKIQYMAPEQALGRSVDRRADVWAVGVILYYYLTGKPPYEADNQLAALHLLGSGRPPVPLPPTVHRSIAHVVRKALAHDPENRYPTADALRAALEKAMVDARVETKPSDVAAFAAEHLAKRAAKRHRAVELALAAAAERQRGEGPLKPGGDGTNSAPPPHPSWAPPDPASDVITSEPSTERPSAASGERNLSLHPATTGATIGSASFDTPKPAREWGSRLLLSVAGVGFASLAIGWFALAASRGAAPHVNVQAADPAPVHPAETRDDVVPQAPQTATAESNPPPVPPAVSVTVEPAHAEAPAAAPSGGSRPVPPAQPSVVHPKPLDSTGAHAAPSAPPSTSPAASAPAPASKPKPKSATVDDGF